MLAQHAMACHAHGAHALVPRVPMLWFPCLAQHHSTLSKKIVQTPRATKERTCALRSLDSLSLHFLVVLRGEGRIETT